MGLIPSFYQGQGPGPTLLERFKSVFAPLILVSLIVFLIYGFANWQKSGRFFGFSTYRTTALIDLLSFANFYNGKRVCTQGYYVQTLTLSIIKIDLAEDEFTRSAWVKNATGEEIIPNISRISNRYVEAKLCGYLESQRTGEFGLPPVWNHQITVEKFETFGEPLPYLYPYTFR